MSRKCYPSDISREQFEQIRPMLEASRKRTNRRTVDLYDVFCAILYLLKNAATWRALPSDFPPVSTVRYYFDAWTGIANDDDLSLLDWALEKSGGARAQERWAAALHELLHRGRAKRQEYRYSQAQGL